MKKIGILGGGQLGKMIAIAAHQLDLHPVIFTDDKDSPALRITNKSFVAPYSDTSAILKFGNEVDIVTTEFENIPVNAIKTLKDHCAITPGIEAIKICQDRILEKTFLQNLGIKTAKFKQILNKDQLIYPDTDLGLAYIIKTAKHGYDGKGQALIKCKTDLKNIDDSFFPAVAESVVDFKKEISVIVAKNKRYLINFPVAENAHVNGILYTSTVPAKIALDLQKKAVEIAKQIAESLDINGILAVEFFITQQDTLLVNELAPRPHNSGHWSNNCCDISQFHALLLAITDQEIKNPNLIQHCTMQNIFGKDIEKAHQYFARKNCIIDIYGKKEAKTERKMGHVNFIKSDTEVF